MSRAASDDSAPESAVSQVERLYALFDQRPPTSRVIAPAMAPATARLLLAHHGHMTVTLESHHDTRLRLQVLAEVRRGPRYARRILLRHHRDDRVLLFGIMQVNLDLVPTEARRRIVAKNAPLGRVLIEQGVLRRVHTHSLLEIEADDEIARHFELTGAPTTVHGRIATLFCDEKPTIDLLEIVPPVLVSP